MTTEEETDFAFVWLRAVRQNNRRRLFHIVDTERNDRGVAIAYRRRCDDVAIFGVRYSWVKSDRAALTPARNAATASTRASFTAARPTAKPLRPAAGEPSSNCHVSSASPPTRSL